MASRKDLVKFCLVLLFLQDQSILTDSKITVYTAEGSTINLTFTTLDFRFYSQDGLRPINIEANKYDIISRPNIIELQIKNVTANDTGLYSMDNLDSPPKVRLSITNVSCLPHIVCAIEGSSQVLTFKNEESINYRPIEKAPWKNRLLSKFTIHVQLHINNVTFEDEGYYEISSIHDVIALQVFRLYFINQTHLKTIIGQEGEAIEIMCSCDTGQYITSLTLESNGTVKAIGDNQSVSFSFIPDRTDHLTKYKCVDSNHSSIMIEVELSIRYAPAVTIRYRHGTVECNCDGIPPIYSVYRLDQISKYGELVRSINLNNDTFVFTTDPFPYQRNGRYMCVVSNDIPGTNGKVLQNSSAHINYEGPPVFAKENRYVKIGKLIESSITISFLVYSCPDVEEIFLQKLGRMRGKKRKVNNYVLKTTLLYNELDQTTGVPGYDILIESDELDMDEFQAYVITVKNRLGASNFHFEFIKKEGRVIDQREKKYVFTICIVGAVLFGTIILHFGLFIKRARRRVPIHSNENDDRTYHTYDEIGSIMYGVFSNIPSSNTNNNQGPNLTQEHADTFSNEYNVQSTDTNLAESNDDPPNDELPQHGFPGVQEQHMSIYMGYTNIIDDKEQFSDQQSQARNDSDSKPSQTVMIGNFGDRPITRSYTDSIGKIKERNQTISDADSGSSNNTIVGNERNEYENNYQLQVGHLYLDILDDRQIAQPSYDSIAKIPQKSQTISDVDSGSSNNTMVGNARNEYENNYQLQDGHLYLDILDERPINLSSTDSIAKIRQISQTISDAGSGSSKNSMVGNGRNEYENNYRLQDGHMYLDILDDRPTNLSSTDSIANIQQRSQTISDADSGSSNNTIVGNERNEYENNYQLQVGHLYLDILDDRQIAQSSSDSIANIEQRSQTISDADSGSSNIAMVGNLRNEYENNYKLQDGHLHREVLDDRQISISANDSRTNNQQQSQTSDDSDSGSSNNVIVGNDGDGFENPYQMIIQDHVESHPYTELIRERHSGTSSTEYDKSENQRVHHGSAKE